MFGPLSSPPQMLYSNSFSGALPTQIGQLTQMTSRMVSQGPSPDNDTHTHNIEDSADHSHGAIHTSLPSPPSCPINSRASKRCTRIRRPSP